MRRSVTNRELSVPHLYDLSIIFDNIECSFVVFVCVKITVYINGHDLKYLFVAYCLARGVSYYATIMLLDIIFLPALPSRTVCSLLLHLDPCEKISLPIQICFAHASH